MVPQSIRSLVLLLALPGLACAEDTVTFRGGPGGQQTLRRTGTIRNYSSEGVLLSTSAGREETIPFDRLLAVETPLSEEQRQAETFRSAGQLERAVEAYRAAQKAESRRWVAHRMTPQLMHCLELQGRFDLAGEEFLHLVAQDPETPYFAAVPLAWRSSTADAAVYARAKTWLENEREPIALLLGASWLLSGPERPRAIGVLTTLSTHSDRRIARLAAAQLWRTKLVSASSADVTRWQVQVANMPETLRGGPMLVLGDALQRQRRTDDAALAYLQASLRYSDRELLAAEGLLAAARLLENARREGDAQRLYRELEAKHSAFAHVNEVVVPHSTASAGTQP